MENSSASPAALDFITALGRLLRDGALRDDYARDPEAVARVLGVGAEDRAAFLALAPVELEAQATVLLRKRFDLARVALPRTLAACGDGAWPEFRRYARTSWPPAERTTARDALGFCRQLQRVRPGVVCARECARMEFAVGRARIAVTFLRAAPARGGLRPAFVIFLRGRGDARREWLVTVGG